MRFSLPRISGVTVLAAAVLVLLPALAWLQYSWLNQISEADRERRARVLQTAAAQLAQDFDGEVGKAVSALQLDATVVEQGTAQGTWDGYADKYHEWAETAIAPEIIKAVYFVVRADAHTGSTAPPLKRWNPQTQTFEETAWPPELADVVTKFVTDVRLPVQGGPRRGERLILPPIPSGNEQTIIVPVMKITGRERFDGVVAEPSVSGKPIVPPPPPPPPDVRLLGFTMIRLDLEAISAKVLPSLVRKHFFDADGQTDFYVGVVSRDEPARVQFESTPGAAGMAQQTPDVRMPLLSGRSGQVMFVASGRVEGRGGRGDGRGGGPRGDMRGVPRQDMRGRIDGNVVVSMIDQRRAAMVETRVINGGDGHWQLVAKHRAGSLEAAVNAARTRNFALSSGILLLLATAIGLIVVSARRADRLARQQIEFVAAVSHELRTPVAVIGAAAGNLADGVVEEPARVKKYGATIQTEARRLGETVERVLQLAGIDSGRLQGTWPPFAIADVVREAITASQHEIDKAGATVELEVAPELPPTAGDRVALRSAIQNLIGNAIKYGGDARWVKVAVTGSERGPLVITVSDRGLGIAADDRKHIFEPFYRGREAVSRQIQGSGLGLHLVQRIVQAHGGTVSVQSEPGQGSTFRVELHATHDVPARRTRASQASPAHAQL